MNTIRWGMIGCGNVTEVKSGPALQKAKNSELVAVMRRNGELARAYARRHDVPRWYDDGAVLINDPEVDAVYIATPPSSHREYTILAAKAGKRGSIPQRTSLAALSLSHRACRVWGHGATLRSLRSIARRSSVTRAGSHTRPLTTHPSC